MSEEKLRRVIEFCQSEQIDESISPQHGEDFPSWSSGYLAAVDHINAFAVSLLDHDDPPNTPTR